MISSPFRILILFIILLGSAYFFVFGRALQQDENHKAILLHLPVVIITHKAVKIDDKTFFAANKESFIERMKRDGFVFTEQMGAGYFFNKDGISYVSESRMYSSHFMVFTIPKEK